MAAFEHPTDRGAYSGKSVRTRSGQSKAQLNYQQSRGTSRTATNKTFVTEPVDYETHSVPDPQTVAHPTSSIDNSIDPGRE